MRIIEYKSIEFPGGVAFNSPETIEALDRLGLDGWTLAGELKETSRLSGPRYFGLFWRDAGASPPDAGASSRSLGLGG